MDPVRVEWRSLICFPLGGGSLRGTQGEGCPSPQLREAQSLPGWSLWLNRGTWLLVTPLNALDTSTPAGRRAQTEEGALLAMNTSCLHK